MRTNEAIKIYEVYKVINIINNKVYVGITNQGFKVRWYKHCSDSLRGSEFPLHNAIRKYGVDNFIIEQLEVCDSIDKLKEREKFWIIELESKTDKNGYNLTDGGDGTYGRFASEETRLKLSQKAKGRIVSDDCKNKLRLVSTNRKPVNMLSLDGQILRRFNSVMDASREFDCSHTNIAKAARLGGISHKYKWSYTNEIVEKPYITPIVEIKEKVKRVTSEETKRKQSISNKENWTESKRLESSLNNIKNRPILQYTLDGEFIKEFYNVAEAVRNVGATTHTNIAKCARGIRKKASGYIWKYKDQINS